MVYRQDTNMYMAHQPQLAERLVAALERGVQVRLLLEAQPPGGLDDTTRWFAQQVHDASGEVRYMRGEPDQHIHRRFVFDHAKYGIIDGSRVFVMSENWVGHGTPTDHSYGNRGWGVIVRNRAVARYLAGVFAADWNPLVADTVAYNADDPKYGGPPAGFTPDDSVPKGEYPHPFRARRFTEPVQVTPVFAPDNTLYDTRGILGLIGAAQERLLVEQQYIHLQWDGRAGSVDQTPDLYLRAVVAAAQRGVEVRVLLDDDSKYAAPPNHTPPGTSALTNRDTCAYLNGIAAGAGLRLECRLLDAGNTGLAKVHNKGVIADDQVLVSSINWSRNSPANNRELGLIIGSQPVSDYFAGVFDWDWEHSG